MSAICLYFQVHQPYRLRRFNYFDIGNRHDYFDQRENAKILTRVAAKCYRPALAMLEELCRRLGESFAVSFSVSGTAIEQFREHAPDVLDAFRRLGQSGRAEFLCETYYHSLAWLASRDEFLAQVADHRRLIEHELAFVPRVFRNTELIYSDDLARCVEELGYSAVLADGIERLLGWRSANFLYRSSGTRSLGLLLRNYRLSDDIAFRFSARGWSEWPLTAEKYVGWLGAAGHDCDVINLFMDFETFGEHQWRETGIFEFFPRMAALAVRHGMRFLTPSEAAAAFAVRDDISSPRPISWADEKRDVSAWMGNKLQRSAMDAVYRLRPELQQRADAALTRDWERLTTSDHFYYMSTKSFADGDVHKYFSPFDSPYEAYINFMHVLADLKKRIG